ncbi:MAG: hypothetical protein GXO56_08135, partial [Chloroflexi bacterium]|nr:hypothetical protein [Chloroflexota bacterium]
DGTTAYPEGTPGWRVTYKYYIEVWDDQTDDTLNPLLGNESLGEDATVTFVDALGNLYENASNDGTIGAELMQCYIGGNGFDPYPYLTDDPDHPERTITDSGEITCSQAGGVGTDVAITVSGADLTLNHYPTESRTGGVILGGNGRYMAAIGAVVVFIPADAARDTSDGNLHLNNCMTDFDPESITGLSNFGDEVENTADNCRTDTFKLYDASFGKAFADSADPPKGYAYVGEGPGEVSYYHAGDGWISPGQEFAAAAYYRNDGGVETHDAAICDVLDAATYDVVDLEGQPGNAVKLQVVHGSYDLSQVQVEYATGYVASTWPPSPPTGQAVVDECADASVTWYSTTTEALANDPNGYPITKIRVTFLDPVPPGTEVRAYIRTKARDAYAETGALPSGVTAGDPIPNGTVLPNFMTATDDGELDGDWHVGDYDPKTTMDEPDEGGRGDRVGLTRAFVRVSKETGNNDEIDSVTLGQQFEFVLKPELITYGEPMATQVTVTDVLPPGLSYVNGSATQGGVSITPTVTACTGAGTPHAACTQSGETVLEWTLDDQMPNEEITPIVFLAEVGLDNADGDVLDNKVIVSSPADSTPEEDRIAHRSVVVAVPNELVAAKSVDRIRREVRDTGPYQWQVSFKNTTPNDLTHLDVIDVLPYNGDTTNPLGSEALARTPPSDFHGVLNFVAVNFADYSDDAQPCGTGGAEATYYFTNVSPDSVNLDPKDPSNTLGAGTIWCEGTADGPGAACGFSNEEVTAVRARSNNTLESGGACRLILETSPAADADGQWHLEGDIYTNTAGATADQLSLPVATNSVSVTIYASSLGDFVWEDTNGNGIQDPGEEGIAGVRLSLLDADGNPVDDPEHPGTPYTVVTDSTGHYTFTNLPAGDYQIKIDADTLPANHGPTAQDQGSDDTLDSDVDANNIINATLPEDTDVDYYDAGYYPYRAIGDTVFYDQNHNGLPDPGEGMEGVRVILTPPPDVDLGNGPGNPIETTTDANGNYLFENLPAGDYTVTVDESTFPSDLAWLQGHNTVDPDGGNDSTSQVTLSREEDRLDQ